MPQVKPKSTYVKELERRSNDLLRVYNPTDEDYVITWDKREGAKLFRAKAKEESVFIRYIAEKYLKEMFNKIITDKADKAVREENERRAEKGMEEMSKWKDQFKFESRFYSPDSEEAKKLLAILYVGIDTEYGIDRESPSVEETVDDSKPIFKQAMDTVQAEKDAQAPVTTPKTTDEPDTTPSPKPPQKPLQSQFECSFPGCGFIAKSQAGLMAHKRSHRGDIEDKKQEATKGVSQ